MWGNAAEEAFQITEVSLHSIVKAGKMGEEEGKLPLWRRLSWTTKCIEAWLPNTWLNITCWWIIENCFLSLCSLWFVSSFQLNYPYHMSYFLSYHTFSPHLFFWWAGSEKADVVEFSHPSQWKHHNLPYVGLFWVVPVCFLWPQPSLNRAPATTLLPVWANSPRGWRRKHRDPDTSWNTPALFMAGSSC